jgi:CO/xanthine dehydrogenase FAD-binding subunit
MAALNVQIHKPASFTELFALWNRFPAAVPYAGGTSIILGSGSDSGDGALHAVYKELPDLPANVLSLEKLDELKRITRTERYLEIGAMVRLSEISALGKIVPEAVSETIKGIAGPQLRNLATIGGNLCISGDVSVPMAALNAKFELRNAGGSRWISTQRFSTFTDDISKQELLTRIRIPLDEWNYTIYRKFLPQDSPNSEGGVLILLIKNQKNILSGIQMVFAPSIRSNISWVGEKLLREKMSETFLEGKTLPLDRRDALHCKKLWKTYLSGMERPGPLLQAKILNSIEAGILGLTD